jgi:hypothetical protein
MAALLACLEVLVLGLALVVALSLRDRGLVVSVLSGVLAVLPVLPFIAYHLRSHGDEDFGRLERALDFSKYLWAPLVLGLLLSV